MFSLILAFATSALLIYGIFYEPRNLRVRNKTIDLADYTGQPITLVLISDLHVGRFYNSQNLPKVVDTVNSIEGTPYILMLGDMVNNETTYLNDLDVLGNLRDDAAKFYVYGNHDLESDDEKNIIPGLTDKIESLNFNILDNTFVAIGDSESKLIIAGINDTTYDKDDYHFLDGISENDAVVLMSHNPDSLLKIDADQNIKNKIDLVVSGHTHAGEMRLPLGINLSLSPAKIGNKYDKGLFDYNGTQLFITAGIGNVGTRLRTFNPPEIAIITIK